MATKPIKFPRWAVPTGSTTPTTGATVEPTEGKKDVGWTPNEKPPAEIQNWLLFWIYMWILYLDDLANQAFTWTKAHVFTTTTTNTNAITATGNGTGAGVAATGGASSGSGGVFVGGSLNGRGAEIYGTGAGQGLLVIGGSGGGSGAYVSASNARAGEFYSTSTGTNYTVYVQQNSTAGALYVTRTAAGSAHNALFVSSAGALSNTWAPIYVMQSFDFRCPAINVAQGNIFFAGSSPTRVQNPNLSNALYGANIVKAWGRVASRTGDSDATRPKEGYNFSACVTSSQTIDIVFARAINTEYSVVITANGGAVPASWWTVNETSTGFTIRGQTLTSGFPNVSVQVAGNMDLSFIVIGRQT